MKTSLNTHNRIMQGQNLAHLAILNIGRCPIVCINRVRQRHLQHTDDETVSFMQPSADRCTHCNISSARPKNCLRDMGLHVGVATGRSGSWIQEMANQHHVLRGMMLYRDQMSSYNARIILMCHLCIIQEERIYPRALYKTGLLNPF